MHRCQSQVYFTYDKTDLHSQNMKGGGSSGSPDSHTLFAWLTFRAGHDATQMNLLQRHHDSSIVEGCLTVPTHQAGDA